jgi:uncharacterized oxidoreductase
MQLSGNTVLITGGTSGIGFELAAQLLARGNRVLITGRDQAKLDAATRALPGLRGYLSDVSDPQQVAALYDKISGEFPTLNVLINNAGIMRKLDLQQPHDLEDVTREIAINLDGPIRMVQQFLPLLKQQAGAAIVNVSSGLAFVPMPISPVYCATKAAIHSYTQSLRVQLKRSAVKVFELAPPGTETPLFHGDFTAEDVKNVMPMPVKTMVAQALAGMEKDHLEIRPGLSNVLKIMSRIAPQFMLSQLSKPVDRMLAAGS